MDKTKKYTVKLLDDILKKLSSEPNLNMLTSDLIETISKNRESDNIKLNFDKNYIESSDFKLTFSSEHSNLEFSVYLAIEYLHKHQFVFHNHQGRHVTLSFDGLMKLYSGGFEKEKSKNKLSSFLSDSSNLANVLTASISIIALIISIFC